MAEKRMFSKKIIDTDWFMDMPASTQNLYFHLSMRADDDGFIASPKRIIKLIGATEDDYKILIGKKFIIPFDSGICVITDWRINNYLRNDRYTETIYKEEKQSLILNKNGKYEFGIPNGIPIGIPTVSTEKNTYSNSKNYNYYNNNIIEEEIKNKEEENNKIMLNEKKDYSKNDVLKEMLDKSDLSKEVKTALNDWFCYKTERKQRYTERGFSSLLTITKKKCLIYGDKAVIDLIEECEANQWVGIIWDKLNQLNNKNNKKINERDYSKNDLEELLKNDNDFEI